MGVFIYAANQALSFGNPFAFMQCVRGDKKMKKKILAGLLLAGSTMFAAPRISFGIGIEVPAPVVVVAPPVYAAVPPCPGPGYVFVDGVWRFGGPGWRGPAHFDRFDRHFEHFRR